MKWKLDNYDSEAIKESVTLQERINSMQKSNKKQIQTL